MTFQARYDAEVQSPEHTALLEEFTRWISMHRREATAGIRIRHIRRLMVWAESKSLGVDTITTRNLVDWLTSEIGPKPETKKSAKASLGVFYGWAQLYDQVSNDPTSKLPPIRVPAGLPRPCPELQLQKGLHRATRPCDVLMLLLAAYAGLRASEIACLHTRNVVDGTIRVSGKGGKDRIVPLHPAIEEWVPYFDDGPFFPSRLRVVGHVWPASIGRRVRWLLDSPGWGCHTLRHRFATEVYRHSTDLLGLRDLLGHSSVATTEIYARSNVDKLTSHVSALPVSDALPQVRRAFATA